MDEGLELDDEWDCDSHDSYPDSSGNCNLRQPTQAERDQFDQLANEIRTDDPVCQQIHDMALVAGQNLMVWDERVQVFKDGSWKTLYGDATWDADLEVPGMHLWASRMNSRTIGHEAMHHLQDPNGVPGSTWQHSGEYYGRTMEEWGHYCT